MTSRFKIIVADAGPLIILSRTVGLTVIHAVASEIHAPAAVIAECTTDMRKPGARLIHDAVESGKIKMVENVDVSVLPDRARIILGTDPNKNLGEREAIALAMSMKGAVILDDGDARNAARGVPGVHVIGTARILAEASLQGKLPKPLQAVFAEMAAQGFYLGEPIKEAIRQYLRRAKSK